MKLPSPLKNWISIIGLLIAVINLALIIILFLISTILDEQETYLGLFIYIILPGFMLLGLLMMPAGIIISRRKAIAGLKADSKRLPVVDLNNPNHKKAFVTFTIITLIILLLSTYGSFEAYHLTESVPFCGTLCHKVMEPEYTAYQNSPHANISCVECHVGSGASWYVKSKLSGLHQVYAVLAKTYKTPIPTPLHDLRPARETCEQCHWPQKFYSRTLQSKKYYMADSLNTEWDIVLQMKTGPQYSNLGLNEGIHWHINPDVNIEYISENDQREVITWIKYTNKSTGQTTFYKNPDIDISDSIINASGKRSMDCIDCHNRPTHIYNSPPVYFDNAMLKNEISGNIPFIKKAAMEVLRNNFPDKDSAIIQIRESISAFYKSELPEYYDAHKDLIDKAISALQSEFSKNTFPSMKVTYDVYPNHIGHLESEGCFRCHNDAFVSDNGRRITRDCNLCHTIIGQGKKNMMQFATVNDTLEFIHPIDIGTVWKEANCSECHRYLY
ncbi:MAG TPA: NapC/NirT family cytochrome c [Bacteroidales bacterium]|nr:NapC/NirT family cytochrome c [Bacteroidales bacterium]